MNPRFRDRSILSILALINGIFAFKYLDRLHSLPVLWIGTLVFALVPFLVLPLLRREGTPASAGSSDGSPSGTSEENPASRPAWGLRALSSPRMPWILFLGFAILSVLFFQVVPQHLIRVDRWEMIDLFWDNTFAGRCSYLPRAAGTNIPSPFPVYFYLFLPFRLLHEAGYVPLAAVAAFIAIVTRQARAAQPRRIATLLLLLSSPAVVYEVFVRSTIFLNSLLAILFLLYAERADLQSRKGAIALGVLGGLCLSTRSVAFLLLAAVALFRWRAQLLGRHALLAATTAVLVFVATFLPVLAVCGGDFARFNPFAVQASIAPTSLMIALSILLLAVAPLVKSRRTFGFLLGATCFILFAGHLANAGSLDLAGLVRGEHAVDISYSAFAIPFLLFGLCADEEAPEPARPQP